MFVQNLDVVADQFLRRERVESAADRIDRARDLLGGAILGPLEQHVFNEVRYAALFVGLFARTRADQRKSCGRACGSTANDKKIAARFKEETLYDEMLNRVIITYIPENPAKEEIQEMELLVTPNAATGDKVNNIIINVMISDKDGFLQKNMLWQMDKSFQVASVSKKPGQPETTSTMKVTWNEGYDQ